MVYISTPPRFSPVQPHAGWDVTTQSAASGPPLFALLSEQQSLVGYGESDMLPPGPADTLGQRIREFFRKRPAAYVLAGALPFDRRAPDHLVSAACLRKELPPRRAGHPRTRHGWSIRAEPSEAGYAAAVREALGVLTSEAAGLRKIVLARQLLAECDRTIDVDQLLHTIMTDPSVMTFLVPLPRMDNGTPRSLIGATPELLISKTGAAIVSHPLAGSARRSADPDADEAARQSLLASEKDAREHAFVVEFILDVLAPHCRTLSAPDRGATRATKTMWHLGTRIEGVVRNRDQSVAELAALLHPTPAVCGVPQDRAAALIPALEKADRGFYAGAVGWCDRYGDGAWHVSIRCAEISGRQARLYAGAGIVPGSEPEAEVGETAAKFRAMLHALGADAEEVRS